MYVTEKITLHSVHCLISMYQITNLCDKYLKNEQMFQCSGIGAIFQNLFFEKKPGE